MRGSSAVLASFLAASTVALSSCSAGENDVVSGRSDFQRSSRSTSGAENERVSPIEEKFAPRFDGLKRNCSAGENDVVIGRSDIQRGSRSTGGAGNERVFAREEKFAPRFDGLKFIESLVTAHR